MIEYVEYIDFVELVSTCHLFLSFKKVMDNLLYEIQYPVSISMNSIHVTGYNDSLRDWEFEIDCNNVIVERTEVSEAAYNSMHTTVCSMHIISMAGRILENALRYRPIDQKIVLRSKS